jgi:hypothetical protein
MAQLKKAKSEFVKIKTSEHGKWIEAIELEIFDFPNWEIKYINLNNNEILDAVYEAKYDKKVIMKRKYTTTKETKPHHLSLRLTKEEHQKLTKIKDRSVLNEKIRKLINKVFIQ